MCGSRAPIKFVVVIVVRAGRTLGIAGAVAALLLLLCACGGSTPEARKAAPTPIAKLNTAAMAIPRVDFCSRVPATAIRAALGTSHWRPASYRNGDRTGINGITDTAAEDGCAWAADSGAALARAWVFAPPVHSSLAHVVIAEAKAHPGCSLVHGPDFGKPSLTQRCKDSDGIRVRHAGLFGTTWLSREVSDQARARAVRKRANAWCVQIVNALNTTR